MSHHRASIHIATHVNFVLHAVDVIPVVYYNIKEDLQKHTDKQSLYL